MKKLFEGLARLSALAQAEVLRAALSAALLVYSNKFSSPFFLLPPLYPFSAVRTLSII